MNRRLTFRVLPEMAGMTIRAFLREELDFSGHQISRLKFQEDGIRVNGEKAYVSHVLREGEVLTIGLTEQVLRRDTEGGKPAKIWEPPAPELGAYPLKVLYEDDDYLIVDKPAGMVCHPSPGHYSDTLSNQAAAHLGGTGTAMDIRVTGRLDRETSGIVTFARSTEAAAGTVVSVSKKEFSVACGEGALRVLTVQPESKKRMPAAVFLNGHGVKAGDVLGSKE